MKNYLTHLGCRLQNWPRRLKGVVLVEVLVAATVMALGVAGISVMQPMLSASSDAARLRAEATRLAQQKLDQFRSFQQVQASTNPAVITYHGTIVSSSAEEPVSLLSNTTFYRSWVVTPRPAAENDAYKLVTVTVRWTGRDGVAERVRLSTTIARADPADLGTLAVGPGAANVRQPRGRHIDIPFDAVTVGDLSKYTPFGVNSPEFWFNNKTGMVSKVCVGASCQEFTTAYGLSGYVRFCPETGGCDPVNPAGKAKRSLLATTASTAPLSLDSSNGLPPAFHVCYSGRQVVLNNGTVVPDVDQVDTDIQARLIGYFCVVQPTAMAGKSSPPWSGRLTLNAEPASGWVISATAAGAAQPYKVCRYSADYERTATLQAACVGKNLDADEGQACRMTNNEHPLWYRGVTASLLNQNYLVVKAANACPTMGAANPLGNPATYVNASTVTHQTNGGTTDGAELSFTCVAQNCSDKLNIEPSTLSTLLLTE